MKNYISIDLITLGELLKRYNSPSRPKQRFFKAAQKIFFTYSRLIRLGKTEFKGYYINKIYYL